MPFGQKPQCVSCKSTASILWRKSEKGEVICNNCSQGGNDGDEKKDGSNNGNGHSGSYSNNNGNGNIVLRKSTRTRTNKSRVQSQVKSGAPKGKGRRIIFKKSATKAATAVATPISSDSIYYKGTYYQIGDIVSMLDVENDVYYAQIRGLLQDQYCEKSAVVTWLLPTESSPRDRFDPSTYILGPEEEIPRKLQCMEFVSHAPSDYYKARNTPYPTIPHKPDLCFVWTRLRPQIKAIKQK